MSTIESTAADVAKELGYADLKELQLIVIFDLRRFRHPNHYIYGYFLEARLHASRNWHGRSSGPSSVKHRGRCGPYSIRHL